MIFIKLSALATLLAAVSATYSGFNYGSTNTDGSAVTQAQFETLFTTAQGLPNTNGQFTAARLYTMIQAGTANGVISAIPAAINTNTYLLLGLWASAGQANFDNEIAALNSAITQYGTAFTSRIAAISVGSEDLYRISPTGIANLAGAGADPATIVNYITQVRAAIAGTSASGAQITHVDTWTAWANSSNSAVAKAVDFLSMDAYPYFQTTTANDISNGKTELYDAIGQTQAAAPGKAVWVTETGWPVSGTTLNQAVASVANAKQYWDDVQCSLKGNYNMFWYTLQDSYPDPVSPSFGIIGSNIASAPLFDLTCPAASTSSSATTSTISSTISSSGVAVSTSVSTTTSVSSSVVSASSASSQSSTSALPVVTTATTAAFVPSNTASVSSEPSSIVGTGSRTTISVNSTAAAATSSAASGVATSSVAASASSAAASASAAAGSTSSSLESVLSSATVAAQSASAAISSASAVAATATGAAKSSASAVVASASSVLSSASVAASSVSSVLSTHSTSASATKATASASVTPYNPTNGAAAVVPGVMAAIAGVVAYVL